MSFIIMQKEQNLHNMAASWLLYLHDGIQSWLQARQMFLLHLNTLLDLLFCSLRLFVFLCQPATKHQLNGCYVLHINKTDQAQQVMK